MMAQAVPDPPPSNKKRVKVYELRNSDWFDRGTGFCNAEFTFDEVLRQDFPRVYVQSEENPDRILLETRIAKEDLFQKQQDTLIVWTEPTTNVDMALSFQEAEGCATIWKFVSVIQQRFVAINGGSDDALDDDLSLDHHYSNVNLPAPSLGNLGEIADAVRQCNATNSGRDQLAKFIISEDYIKHLVPLVEMAEDMEDLGSLHKLCTIMKIFILLNDNSIMETVVRDDLIIGSVGALEYDPDFPSHKANHRQWLSKEGRFKEVIRIKNDEIRKKIHTVYRLQYLKDVVLARILDDPTFSVLNSLIFFQQVDIVQHIQNSPEFLKELFGIFAPGITDQEKRKEAVLFIQQCCAIAKNLQPQGRNALYSNFLAHGLLSVITFALRHKDVVVRVGATDVLVSMIDHDPQMIRQTIFRQISEKQTPLTDSLIDLLLVEADLGVKAQIADAIKVLLDPGQQTSPLDGPKVNGEFGTRIRPQTDPQQVEFVKDFYEISAKKLFKPLVDLKDRQDMNYTVQQVSLFIYLIEILCFFVRQHTHYSKYFVLSEKLANRIAQLLSSPEKYLKLTALKFFRNLIGLQDEFYNQQMTQGKLLEPILNLVIDTMPRDNLLNSAALEFFEFVRAQQIKNVISHLVEHYRDQMKDITYVDLFQGFISKYDDSAGFDASMEASFIDTEGGETPKRSETGTRRWDNQVRDLDPSEEEYFNTSDDEDDVASKSRDSVNGASPLSKPLVDYPSDEENDHMDISGPKPNDANGEVESSKDGILKGDESERQPAGSLSGPSPPERLSEKRRREEDEEDELGKLSHSKRRTSNSSTGSNTSSVLRRKQSFSKHGGAAGVKPGKIAISLSPAIKTGGDNGGGEDGS